MMNGYGMKRMNARYSKPQECSICKRMFLTPQDLISHFETFHSHQHFSTFSSSSATATPFRQYPNRNPNPGFPARNHNFDLNYYQSGYLDGQGRFHKGFPTTPTRRSNFSFEQQKKKLKSMDLFPEMSLGGNNGTLLPLLSQLEQRRPEETVEENGEVNSSSIDLTLRL